MKGSILNKIHKIFFKSLPLGFIVWFVQKYMKPTDNQGKTIWTRLWSSYGEKGFNGAEVLIRQKERLNNE